MNLVSIVVGVVARSATRALSLYVPGAGTLPLRMIRPKSNYRFVAVASSVAAAAWPLDSLTGLSTTLRGFLLHRREKKFELLAKIEVQ